MADEQAIRAVISEQFSMEVASKEEELQKIDDRIQLAKMMLQRLRLGILAQQYGLSGFYLMEDYSKENVGVQTSWDRFESEFLGLQLQQTEEEVKGEEVEKAGKREDEGGEVNLGERQPHGASSRREVSTPDMWDGAGSTLSSAVSSQVSSEAGEEESDAGSQGQPAQLPCLQKRESSLLNNMRGEVEGSGKESKELLHTCKTTQVQSGTGTVFNRGCLRLESRVKEEDVAQPSLNSTQLPASLSRYCSKKRIIVGNTSQYLDPSAHGSLDSSTHKWMVYVRGPSEDPDISSFVKAVRFFLHPSYHPNDIIRISKAPFQLTRYGWGEFPVRVQLEFSDKQNKHVDIIHNLVLDRTHTGHQTLGAETVVDLDLLTPDSLLHHDRGVLLRNNSLHPHKPLNELKHDHSPNSDPRHNALHHNDPKLEEPPFIQHIFVPTSSPPEQVLLDHSYSQVVVVTYGSRPEPASQEEEEGMDTSESDCVEQSTDLHRANLDRYLHSMVKTTPLCGPESNGFHLVAPSTEHFKKWNIGRRRAAEWMRAIALKRLVQTQESLPMSASLTTKQVVDWCRKNGYTPLDPATPSGPGFCKYCGCQLGVSWSGEEGGESELNCHRHCSELMEIEEGEGEGEGEEDEEEEEEEEEGEEEEEEPDEESESDEESGVEEKETKPVRPSAIGQRFSTLSAPFDLLESVISKDKELRQLQEQQERDQAVDVVTVSSRQRGVTEPVPRFRVPQTPELKWVQQTAAAIGIPIYPAVIDRMYAHVVEHMIYMACTKFARGILNRAVSESAQQVEGDSSEERTLVPLHIYRAIQSLDTCDFLTNSFMGLPTLSSGELGPGETQ